ncbi:MAG: bifunctional YncE family protein/alkaline phosphatase family protein [Fimbriimonas sp.]
MLTVALLLAAQADRSIPVFTAPAGNLPTKIVPGGATVLPNGRLLTPSGDRLYTGEDLWNVTLSPSGDIAVGFHDGGFTAYSGLRGGRRIRRGKAFKDIAPCGRFTIDSRQLVVSLGDEGAVAVLDTGGWEELRRIPLDGDGVKDSYLNDFVLSADDRYVYGVDIANGQLVTIDLAVGKVVSRVKAGRLPFAIARSEDGQRLYVANVGLFDYARVAGGAGNPRGLTRPPFGIPSDEATKGVELEGKKVPGLGSLQAPEAQSVWMYDVENGIPKFGKSVKCGLAVGATSDGSKVVGGSSPTALLVRGGRLFVSNAHQDTVQVFGSEDLKPMATWKLSPHKGVERLRGTIPGALALSGDGKRLYVCERGLNAVAILDTATGRALGRIPTGWLPTGIKLDEVGGRLLIAAQKGLGTGPRGSLNLRSNRDERSGLPSTPGMIQVVKLPTDEELANHTQAVLKDNGLVPVEGSAPVFPKEIKHVVLITKSGPSFDGIFGDLRGANGQPEYAEFGRQGWIRERGREERVPIMPNHLRLAEQFAIGDNFYSETMADSEGHRWLGGTYPSILTARMASAGWKFRAESGAKGRWVSFGGHGAPIPEEYPESGSLWDHLDRGGISFRNYGEGFDFPGADKGPAEGRSGAFQTINFPMPQSLYANTRFEYPTTNATISDLARVDWFLADVRKKPFPRFLNVALGHEGELEARPQWGFPYAASFRADNDLALGRLVEWLTHQPEWRSMAIFVTQSSARDDDHVDRHRSFAMVVSPYAKRGYVSSRHTSTASVLRSVYGLLGLPPKDMFDALAAPMDDMFTDRPDFAPYTPVPSDPRVFKPEETMDPSEPRFKKRRG